MKSFVFPKLFFILVIHCLGVALREIWTAIDLQF